MEIFSRVSKVIQARLGFTQLRFVIGKENSRHPPTHQMQSLRQLRLCYWRFPALQEVC